MAERGTASVAEQLHEQGWALANLASLPHISVAGAVATGTHGSGDRNGSLAAAVQHLDLLGADGEIRRLDRADPDFPGSVVALGALGIAVRLTLAVQPTFELRQDLFTGLPWRAALEDLEALTSTGYSVSLFTDWTGETIDQVWVKSRGADGPPEPLGARRADRTLHMLRGGELDAVTEQNGVLGPWHERLPHFRMAFTPSRGEELQTEYLLPRARAVEAIEALRRLAPTVGPVLQVSEIRTVAADDLWLSGAYGTDAVALHFTWLRDVTGVRAVLPAVEEALLPLGGRPHWGKCFAATSEQLAPAYPRFADFRALRDRVDPDDVFGNAFLDRVLGPR